MATKRKAKHKPLGSLLGGQMNCSDLSGVREILENSPQEFRTNVPFNNVRLTEVSSPVDDTDAANKAYVDDNSSQWDNVAGGINYDNGNVGIGTDSPDYDLEVIGEGGTDVKTVISVRQLDDGAGHEGGRLSLVSYGWGNWAFTVGDPSYSGSKLFYGAGGYTTFKSVADGLDFTSLTGASLLRILDGGNVGIGTTVPSEKLDVAGNIKSTGALIGDTTNYTEIKSDGEINLHGTARVTKRIQLPLKLGTPAPTTILFGNFEFYAFTIGDNAYTNTARPLDWDEDTDVDIYLSWGINEAYSVNNGEIQWQVDWSNVEDSEDYGNPTNFGVIKSGDINIPTTARTRITTKIGTIPASKLSTTGVLGIKLSRVAIDNGNNPSAAEPATPMLYLDYKKNKLGEAL